MAEATPNYAGVPEVFSGARARFRFSGVTVGYAAGVSGEETIELVA